MQKCVNYNLNCLLVMSDLNKELCNVVTLKSIKPLMTIGSWKITWKLGHEIAAFGFSV